MSTINRGAFESSFQHGTVEELTQRAANNGVRINDRQRDAIGAADLNNDGVVGNGRDERRALWNALDDMDRDGSRRTMNNANGDGCRLARGMAVRGSYFKRNAASEAYSAGQRGFNRARGIESEGRQAEAATGFAAAADHFESANEAMDAPQARTAMMQCLAKAAECAEAAGDPQAAAEYRQRATEAARGLLERYPDAAHADQARELIARS